MAGELYASTEVCGCAFMVKHDLTAIFKEIIPRTLSMDSKQIFNVVTKAAHTTEERWMIDIVAAKEA